MTEFFVREMWISEEYGYDYYITVTDEEGDECLIEVKDGKPIIDTLIGNKSEREDRIVYNGTFEECSNYIASMYEDDCND